MLRIFLGTSSGVYKLDDRGLTCLGLKDHAFSAVYALEPDIVLAGSYGDGIFRSLDGGKTWDSNSPSSKPKVIRTFSHDSTGKGDVLCGTEPGRGFRSADCGQTWQEISGISKFPNSSDWFLPYSPRAGALRNFYSPPCQSQCLFASIEVGGLLSSTDGGETWTRLDLFDDDIHFITGHPEIPQILWVALGWAALKTRKSINRSQLGGLARSPDGGKTWSKVIERDYTRAIIVPPNNSDLVLAGPAYQVGKGGRIMVSSDQGQTWDFAGEGIEDPMEDMVEGFFASPDGSIFAICSQGRLFCTYTGKWNWDLVLDEFFVNSICFVDF